ncbi:hypothetical protein [Bacteroides sp.]
MRNLLKLSLVLVSIGLYSCAGEDDVLSGVNSEAPVLSYVQTRALNSLPVTVCDGVLVFESADSFIKTAETISNLSDEALEEWEQSIGFSSYRTKVNRLIEEAEAIEDSLTRHNYVVEHGKFIKEVGEDIFPVIGSQLYCSVVDENGVFYVNQTKNVVDENTVSGYNAKSRSVQKTTYTGNTSRGLVSNLVYETREKKVGKRKVITSAKVVKYVAFDAPNTRYSHGVEILVDGKKRGPAKWKHYTTDHHVKEVTIEFEWIPIGIDANKNLIYGHFKDEYNATISSGNSHRLIKTYSAGYPSPIDINLFGVNMLTYKAFTRGTGEADYLFYAVLNGETQP